MNGDGRLCGRVVGASFGTGLSGLESGWTHMFLYGEWLDAVPPNDTEVEVLSRRVVGAEEWNR